MSTGNASRTGRKQPVGSALDAPAKINLSLHIEGRRPDGYHQLSGLVAFARIADHLHLSLLQGPENRVGANFDFSLDVEGPFSGGGGDDLDLTRNNLVVKAARLYCQATKTACTGEIRLQKNLPVAAGLGGGSSDAAALLTLMQKLGSSPLNDERLSEIALQLGADVPMCLTPRAQMIGGTGEVRQPVETFAPLHVVLVNPRLPVSTAQVFEELRAAPLAKELTANTGVPPDLQTASGTIKWLREQRNDLQAPAIRLAPVIGKVLEELAGSTHCRLSRMSGSGASCFGLFEDEEQAEQAAREIGVRQPGWWVVATVLN